MWFVAIGYHREEQETIGVDVHLEERIEVVKTQWRRTLFSSGVFGGTRPPVEILGGHLGGEGGSGPPGLPAPTPLLVKSEEEREGRREMGDSQLLVKSVA